MVEVFNAVSFSLLLLGSLCNVVASIGLFRFPDLHSRMHATGITDTLGTGLILTGLLFHPGWEDAAGKLALLLLFSVFTSPTVSYVLANTAKRQGAPNAEEQREDNQAGRVEP